MNIISNCIIHTYIDDIKNKSLNYRIIYIKSTDGIELKVIVNTNSKINNIKSIFKYYFKNYPDIEFFIPSSGKIINDNEYIGNYIDDNKINIIKKIN